MTDKKQKSFVLYADFESALLKLSIKERGILFTMIFSYVNRDDIDEFTSISPLVDMAFEIIRAQLDRDRAKYEKKCAQNAQNGKLGGRPRSEIKPKRSERFFEKPKKAYNDNDNKNDNDNYSDTDNDNELKVERSFDPREFFAAALARSLGEEKEKEK